MNYTFRQTGFTQNCN